ncbi:5-(carboxyamino)imidazole ribonucleotide synthase [Salinibacterium sp. M195]|uniref:5-(carboxyamino)imidazole ribonucleotide synthase n=1 Tax=Salinibacterium sp. M195 TaxID=2583374 RepID=UPI001C6325D1|nr:5-(carboxyamino)imidazole ribonucleotide synthase [Salinibacterium sp. M195]QYH35593.1 5-(carboxyamino)imidazole ribonucleotide synthase [Salinibacterium sp. M195]
MPPIVGVIGGGQLARMMIPRAIELGFELRVLAEAEGMSAAIAATAVGDYRDAATVLEFARDVDVITFDHEHVPQDVLAQLAEAGVSVHPGAAPLAVAQDKILMRQELTRLGLPVPEWASVSTPAELEDFLAANGGRVIVKTPRGGYDGKGVRVVSESSDVADWFEAGGPLLAEELVSFTRELAQLAARSPSGEVALWPLVESIQQDGVCAEVIAPAPSLTAPTAAAAAEIARTVADKLGVTGVLAVELFETADGQLLINELAMRPHNSGHWTMDGAVTSQFEQHLRAVLDLPLGATDARSPWTVMINVLGGPTSGTIAERYPLALANQPTAKFHEYGKAPRPGRKVGHVNVSGVDLDDVVYRARAAAAILKD